MTGAPSADWQLNTDGGSRGNPGPAGLGFSLTHGGETVLEAGWFLGTATNNVAEYSALIWGLSNALALGVTELSVRADSELMVRQMTGAYKVKNPDLKLLHARASRLAGCFTSIDFAHVRRERNSAADHMANEAMDAGGAVGTYEVAFSDADPDDDGSTGSPSPGSPSGASPQPVPEIAFCSSDPQCSGGSPSGASPQPVPEIAFCSSDPQCSGGSEPSRASTGSPSGGAAKKTLLLGVTGGIAAYKSCELVRLIQKAAPDVSVKVVMTGHATEFVGPATFRALTGNEVAVSLFDGASEPIHHISLAEEADAAVIAPATANVISKIANGAADDLLTTTVLAMRAPVLVAPAMNSAMWADAATRENMGRIAALGMRVVGPDTGELACGDVGEGRMADVARIAEEALALLEVGTSLSGRRVLVTAGPTHEAIDPVRYIANRSSGRQGYAIAEEAVSRGAEVTLVTGPTSLVAPVGADVVRVESAAEMLAAAEEAFESAAAAIFAAAVADWRPESPSAGKLKRDGSPVLLALEPNVDIAAELGSRKGARHVTVFAAECGDPLDEARRKLVAKNADLVVANDVTEEGAGFSSPDNHVWLVDSAGVTEVGSCSKRQVARRILDRVSQSLQ